MLEIKNVSKSYNKNQVLFDVSINISLGEIHGLIGENSAGKTTLIKCAAGIYKPDAGKILYDGEPIYDNPKVKEKLGYVADYNDYIPSYKVIAMVHMYESFFPDFDKNKFNEMNKRFEIPVNKTVHSLSKGQKMRLAFMLETSKHPKYFLLDEPTSGLDPVARAAFYEMLIDEIEKNEMCILISSHNLDGLEKICDSVTMMSAGRVKKQHMMDDMKNELTKLNVVFKDNVTKKLENLPWILKMENTGSIYSLLVKEYDMEKQKELLKMGATLIEPIDISLEELFVALSEKHK